MIQHGVPPGVQAQFLVCGGGSGALMSATSGMYGHGRSREIWTFGTPGVFQVRGFAHDVTYDPSSLREIDEVSVPTCVPGGRENDLHVPSETNVVAWTGRIGRRRRPDQEGPVQRRGMDRSACPLVRSDEMTYVRMTFFV